MDMQKLFLSFVLALGFAGGRALFAEDVDVVLKVKNSPVTSGSMAALFKVGLGTKDPQQAQCLFRAAGAGLLSISQFELYNQRVRGKITHSQEFEQSLMDDCPQCMDGDPECTACLGSGKCASCNGQGGRMIRMIDRTVFGKCGQCQGMGRCARCQGTGMRRCPQCGGRRRILSRELAKARYERDIGEAIAIYSRGETVKAFQFKEYTMEQALEHGISVILEAAQREKVGSIVTTGFLWNGKRDQALGGYYENKCFMTLVNQAPPEMDIMDRDDVKDTTEEANFAKMMSGGKDIKDVLSYVLSGADAFLMGELLYDHTYSQALFALRLIEIRTARVLAATADVVKIDTELCSRLKMNLVNIREQPNIALIVPGNPKMDRCVENLKSADTVVFSSLQDIPPGKQLSARLFFAQLAAEMMKNGVRLIEREFLYDIVEEKNRRLVDQAITELASGGILLKTTCDTTSQDKAGVTFFVRAVTIRGTATKGMFDATLLSPSKY